jgi:hypothetical protein
MESAPLKEMVIGQFSPSLLIELVLATIKKVVATLEAGQTFGFNQLEVRINV